MKWMILACGLILLKYSNHVTARHWPAVCSRCTAVYADHNYFLCLAAGEDICVQLQRPTRLHSPQLVTWEGGNSLVVQVELPVVVVVVVVVVAYFSACIFHQTIYSVAGREPHRAKHCPTLNSKFGLEVLYTGDIMIGLEIWEDIKHH